MTVFRIKHKPTGLFYRTRRYSPDNFSKTGKLYTRRPSMSYIKRDVIKLKKQVLEFITEDWEIIEYDLCLKV